MCIRDSICLVASGYGRRLDVKADCLCKLCKGIMGGQRIWNLRRVAVLGLGIWVNGMVSPLIFTVAGSLPNSGTNRSIGTYAVLFLMIGAEPSENGALIPAMPSTAV